MKATINKGALCGRVKCPPSKSYAHRLLICSAFAEGTSIISNISKSEDISATIDCLNNMGANCVILGDSVKVKGNGGKIKLGGSLKCRESGSTLRFLIPSALTGYADAVFEGTERLLSRGIGVYEELFFGKGVSFEIGKTFLKAKGALASGVYNIKGNVSSQFISGMLFALPLLDDDSTLNIIPPVESRSYIDITIDALSRFGIAIEETGENSFFIKGGQKYRPTDIEVESDWSNGAFWHAFQKTGNDIVIEGLRKNSRQGDRVCVGYMEKLEKGFAELDLSDCPDLAPILFAFAASKHGGHFTGTRRLAIKESDRAKAMADELEKFGIKVLVGENEVTVEKGGLKASVQSLDCHNDHRIVMSLAFLALQTGGCLDGIEAVKKSYPDFFETLEELGAEVIYET